MSDTNTLSISYADFLIKVRKFVNEKENEQLKFLEQIRKRGMDLELDFVGDIYGESSKDVISVDLNTDTTDKTENGCDVHTDNELKEPNIADYGISQMTLALIERTRMGIPLPVEFKQDKSLMTTTVAAAELSTSDRFQESLTVDYSSDFKHSALSGKIKRFDDPPSSVVKALTFDLATSSTPCQTFTPKNKMKSIFGENKAKALRTPVQPTLSKLSIDLLKKDAEEKRTPEFPELDSESYD